MSLRRATNAGDTWLPTLAVTKHIGVRVLRRQGYQFITPAGRAWVDARDRKYEALGASFGRMWANQGAAIARAMTIAGHR